MMWMIYRGEEGGRGMDQIYILLLGFMWSLSFFKVGVLWQAWQSCLVHFDSEKFWRKVFIFLFTEIGLYFLFFIGLLKLFQWWIMS